MTSTSAEVVIIGGSLAGLFTAITIKSLSTVSKVAILERYPLQDLQDLGAGIRCNQEANDAILKYADLQPNKYATYLTVYRFLDKEGNVAIEQKTGSWSTTWGQLYRAFREQVDADPKCSYHHGCTFDNAVEDGNGKIQVQYRDSEGETRVTLADFVVGADGASSKVGSLLDTNRGKRTSAGYVCYRGVVSEQEISPAAAQRFEQAGTFAWPPASQFVSYIVPSNEKPADQAGKCVNWVWYRNKTEDELRQLLTDATGKVHAFTLPHGKMRAEERQKINQEATENLPPVCIEIVEKTAEPFVQVVTDSMASKASFFNGKVLLVGDAVGGQRPHTASAILQGSHHAVMVRQYLEGKLVASKFEEEVLRLSRVLVEGGAELGKILMTIRPPGEGSIPAYLKVFLGIQAKLNEVWKETVGIGQAEAQI